MRILTREYYMLRRLEGSYDLWPCRVDPRASSYDQEFYEEVSEGDFPEMHREFIGYALEKGMSRCPTREEIVEDYKRRHVDDSDPCGDRFPEDVLSMAADPRVLGRGVVSPEVFDYCERKKREASEAADEIYGRWLWHVLEDLPDQCAKAQELVLRIIGCCHRIERSDGGGILLKNYFDEISLADARIIGTDSGSLSAEYCELHRDGHGWILETMNEMDDCDIRFSGFDIVRRHRHEILRPGMVRGHAARGLRLRDEGGRKGRVGSRFHSIGAVRPGLPPRLRVAGLGQQRLQPHTDGGAGAGQDGHKGRGIREERAPHMPRAEDRASGGVLVRIRHAGAVRHDVRGRRARQTPLPREGGPGRSLFLRKKGARQPPRPHVRVHA